MFWYSRAPMWLKRTSLGFCYIQKEVGNQNLVIGLVDVLVLVLVLPLVVSERPID
jgi:hypothetical protein